MGFELDRIIGSRFIDFATSDRCEAMADLLLRGSALAVRGKLSLIFGNSDAAVPVQLSFNPVRIDAAEYIGVVVIDISDREREQQAREAIRIRNEFIALAAHELRNPISTLSLTIAMLERLMSDPQPDAAALQRSVLRIGRQTKRLAELVSRLLDVSKLAHERMILELASHDLGQIVRELVEEYREEALQTKCAIEAQIESGLMVHCDRLRLEQSIANVLSNAIKYGRGKPIFVCARGDQTHAIIDVMITA